MTLLNTEKNIMTACNIEKWLHAGTIFFSKKQKRFLDLLRYLKYTVLYVMWNLKINVDIPIQIIMYYYITFET